MHKDMFDEMLCCKVSAEQLHSKICNDISVCRFHGIEPSKKSKEKIQRKVRDEMAAKKMATSEQPTGSFNHLKNAQVHICSHLCLFNNLHAVAAEYDADSCMYSF